MKENKLGKIKKLIKKTFRQIKNAYSLVEVAISLLVISIIIAALTPTISKRLSASSSIKNRISTNCNSLYPDGYCAMCYITPKKCISCTKTCNPNQFKNVDNCACEECSIRYSNDKCTKCNSKKCTQCENGYYLDSNSNCTICPKGYYCFQQNNTSIKLPCAKGTVAGSEGMDKCTNCLQSTESQTGWVATSTAMSTCINCQNGSYAKTQAQGTGCEACPKGYYCPQGKHIPCPFGYANGLTGQTACSACVQSTNTQTGTVATNTAMSACSSCGNGVYASTNAQGTSCTSCPAAYYCPNGKLVKCTTGYYCPAGSSAMTPCPSRAFCPEGSASPVYCSRYHEKCNTCNTTTCTKCDSGYEVDASTKGCKATTCTPRAGEYVQLNGNRNICWVFTRGSSCPGGYRLPTVTEGCILINGGALQDGNGSTTYYRPEQMAVSNGAPIRRCPNPYEFGPGCGACTRYYCDGQYNYGSNCGCMTYTYIGYAILGYGTCIYGTSYRVYACVRSN